MPPVALIFLCLPIGATVKTVFSLIHGRKTSQRQEDIHSLGDTPGPGSLLTQVQALVLAVNAAVAKRVEPWQQKWRGFGDTEPGHGQA